MGLKTQLVNFLENRFDDFDYISGTYWGSNTQDTGFVNHMDFIDVQLQKLALTSPTSGGCSVSTVCSWTQAMEFSF
jgi:hypothetical protein